MNVALRLTIALRLAPAGLALLALGCADAPPATPAGPPSPAARAAPQQTRISIQLDSPLLLKHGLSSAAVTEQIKAFMGRKPGATLDELSNLRIAKSDGSTVPLSAIATLTQERRSPP